MPEGAAQVVRAHRLDTRLLAGDVQVSADVLPPAVQASLPVAPAVGLGDLEQLALPGHHDGDLPVARRALGAPEAHAGELAREVSGAGSDQRLRFGPRRDHVRHDRPAVVRQLGEQLLQLQRRQPTLFRHVGGRKRHREHGVDVARPELATERQAHRPAQGHQLFVDGPVARALRTPPADVLVDFNGGELRQPEVVAEDPHRVPGLRRVELRRRVTLAARDGFLVALFDEGFYRGAECCRARGCTGRITGIPLPFTQTSFGGPSVGALGGLLVAAAFEVVPLGLPERGARAFVDSRHVMPPLNVL